MRSVLPRSGIGSANARVAGAAIFFTASGLANVSEPAPRSTPASTKDGIVLGRPRDPDADKTVGAKSASCRRRWASVVWRLALAKTKDHWRYSTASRRCLRSSLLGSGWEFFTLL